MTPIQIILLIIIAVIIAKTFGKYRRRSITVREFFLWAIFWSCSAIFVIFPNITQKAANLVGIGRGVDLIIYLALLILFSALFYLIIRVERIERDITKIARKLAQWRRD